MSSTHHPHPWRTLRDHWPHIRVQHCRLPDGVRGRTDGRVIQLDDRLTQVQRRCVLAHEMWHLRRGTVDQTASDAEEWLCDQLAARELVPTAALAHGLRWSRSPAELATALWVDDHTLRVRMSTLDPIEVAELNHATRGGVVAMELTDQQRTILDFEAAWWRTRGAKEDAIAAQFGITAVRYYQLLNALLDEPAALAYAPTVVNRLRRLRSR